MQNHLWSELFGRATSPSALNCFTMGKSSVEFSAAYTLPSIPLLLELV